MLVQKPVTLVSILMISVWTLVLLYTASDRSISDFSDHLEARFGRRKRLRVKLKQAVKQATPGIDGESRVLFQGNVFAHIEAGIAVNGNDLNDKRKQMFRKFDKIHEKEEKEKRRKIQIEMLAKLDRFHENETKNVDEGSGKEMTDNEIRNLAQFIAHKENYVSNMENQAQEMAAKQTRVNETEPEKPANIKTGSIHGSKDGSIVEEEKVRQREEGLTGTRSKGGETVSKEMKKSEVKENTMEKPEGEKASNISMNREKKDEDLDSTKKDGPSSKVKYKSINNTNEEDKSQVDQRNIQGSKDEKSIKQSDQGEHNQQNHSNQGNNEDKVKAKKEKEIDTDNRHEKSQHVEEENSNLRNEFTKKSADEAKESPTESRNHQKVHKKIDQQNIELSDQGMKEKSGAMERKEHSKREDKRVAINQKTDADEMKAGNKFAAKVKKFAKEKKIDMMLEHKNDPKEITDHKDGEKVKERGENGKIVDSMSKIKKGGDNAVDIKKKEKFVDRRKHKSMDRPKIKQEGRIIRKNESKSAKKNKKSNKNSLLMAKERNARYKEEEHERRENFYGRAMNKEKNSESR